MYINTIDSCSGSLSLSGDSLIFPINFSCGGTDLCYIRIFDSLNNSVGRFLFYHDNNSFFSNRSDDSFGYLYLSSGDYVLDNYNFNSCKFGIITDGQDSDNWSALYVNDIQHQSAGTININIPDEISWDYTNENDQFDLTISGYTVDTQYMQDILTIQSYHPSSEDFTESFVGTLGGLFPYIIISLFIVFIWKLIKKVFK